MLFISFLVTTLLAEKEQKNSIDIQAKAIIYDNSILEAQGNVLIENHEHNIQTERLFYRKPYLYALCPSILKDKKNNTLESLAMTAHEKNETIYAKHLDLTLSDRSSFQGYRLHQYKKDQGYIEQGRYTACYKCKGSPTWILKARKISYDPRDVTYQDMTLYVKGLPAFYTPYFVHPHPKVKYRGGILTPTPGRSSDLGYYVHLPLYYPFNEHVDLTFTPIVSTNKKPMISLSNRYLYEKTQFEFGGSYADIAPSSKWHLSVLGEHKFNKNTILFIKIRRASDVGYLLKYPIEKTTSAILPNQQKNLTSQIILENWKNNRYTSVSGYVFQTERKSVTPHILPYIQNDYHGHNGNFFYGSTASFTFLERKESNVAKRYQRTNGDFYGQHTWISKGIVIRNALSAKWDGYHIEDNNRSKFLTSPQAQSTWSYPFVKFNDQTQIITEPLAQIIAQDTQQGFLDDIPYQELDAANLFERYRLRSYERMEKGGRFVKGIRQTFLTSQNQTTQFFLGKTDPLMKEKGYKDWISEASTQTPLWGVRHRNALHQQGFRYSETGLRLGRKWELDLAHIFVNRKNEHSVHQGQWRMAAPLNNRWKVSIAHIHQLGPRAFLHEKRGLDQFFSLHYEDECFKAHLGFYINQYRDEKRGIQPSNGFVFSLVFRNLGPIDLVSGPSYPMSPLNRR